MSKGGTSAPPSVDPTALANAQSNANIQSANRQAELNNVNTTSPFGTSTFNEDANGRWNLSQALAAPLQTAFDTNVGTATKIGQAAGNLVDPLASAGGYGSDIIRNAIGNLGGQIPTGPVNTANLNPIQTSANFSGLVPLPTSTTDFSKAVTGAQNAAYDTQTGYLDPQFSQKHSDLTQQLADQGISAGTQAYDRAQGDLGRQETLAYQQAKDAAVAAGDTEQARLFGEDLSSRGEGVSEALSQAGLANSANNQGFNQDVTKWGEPLAALASAANTGSSLLGGAAANLTGLSPTSEFGFGGQVPTFGSQGTVVPSSNVVGAQSAANTAGMNSFLAGNALNNQLFNGIGSLGGALGLGNGGLGSTLGGLFGFGTGAGGVANSALGIMGLPGSTSIPAFTDAVMAAAL